MTDLAALAQADLNACFDLFEHTAERLEVLPAYVVGGAEAGQLRSGLTGRSFGHAAALLRRAR